MSGYGGNEELDEATQRELAQFLEVEQQKARLQHMVHQFADMCWDKCITKPGNKLSSGEESCVSNCVERFLDSTYFIVNRLEELQKHQ